MVDRCGPVVAALLACGLLSTCWYGRAQITATSGSGATTSDDAAAGSGGQGAGGIGGDSVGTGGGGTGGGGAGATGGGAGGVGGPGGTGGSNAGGTAGADTGGTVGAGGNAGVGVGPGWMPGRPCPTTSAGTPGVWENVTPKAIDLVPGDFNNGNYGIFDVVVDPVHSCDAYAFTSYQGVWRSTDYGSTWTRSTVKGVMDQGRAWSAAIDPNRNRDPSTPPTMYACQGYGPTGLFKSTDGGTTWNQLFSVPNLTGPLNDFGAALPDIYSVDIDPNDSRHLLGTFHGPWVGYGNDCGLVESMDAGANWTLHYPPKGFGCSTYVFFMTSTLWLVIAPDSSGVWRTTTAGRVGGKPATAAWSKVASFGHGHAGAQPFHAGSGVIYSGGNDEMNHYGVFRSADWGATWTLVVGGGLENAVFGTDKFLYTDFGWANNLGQDQTGRLLRSPRSDGLTWTNYYPKPAPGMSNGSKRAAVASDGTHAVIISGMWNAGIWRYVEP